MTLQGTPAEPARLDQDTAASGHGLQTVVIQPPRTSVVTWVIAGGLVVIATCLVLLIDQGSVARAQPVSHAGARGVFAFTGQLSKGTYGLFMVDVDTATVWCYEYLPSKRELRLVACRTWKYDRYLEDFNSGTPTPEEVEQLVEQQRALKLQSEMGAGP
ncbi:MAG TPA: hypothetical protein VM243_11630 [Phycisphaerae bacterium]|nr:hypothetical protein [Phycisphaerae bacterium]